MDEHVFEACDLANYQLWIAGTVCAVGWFSFLIASVFLTIAMVFEHGRLKKTETEIIIFRTSSRNALLEASLLTKAPVGATSGVNTTLTQSPAPNAATNFQLQPPPFRQSQNPKEERVPEEINSPRVFPNSFSYTAANTVPLESQASYQSQANSNYNVSSPPPVPPKWKSNTQTYPTNR